MTPHQDWTTTAQGKEPIGKLHIGEKVLERRSSNRKKRFKLWRFVLNAHSF